MVDRRTSGAWRRGCVLLWAVAIACGQRDESPAGSVRANVDTTRGVERATVVVRGLSRAQLSAWRDRNESDGAWVQAVRVSVAGSDSIAIVGRYAVRESMIEFTPRFSFDRGREYTVRIDPRVLSAGSPDSAMAMSIVTFHLPASDMTPTTRVTRILPTADTLPANLLRIYIEFSAPMSRGGGLPFVHLIDDTGKEVDAPFLPLDSDFWSPDHTRYTMFFDPGRVKTGIKPNVDMGRALVAGRTYTLRVDSTWRDGEGRMLVSRYEQTFRAGPMDVAPIAPTAWRMDAPRAGTRDPLVVRFPEPLDHGLLRRGLNIETVAGRAVDGSADIGPAEREWRFTPTSAWAAGNYALVALDIIEDLAGNRIGRKFEVDLFNRADSTTVPARTRLPFLVR